MSSLRNVLGARGQRRWRSLFLIIRLAVATGLIVVLLRSIDTHAVADGLTSIEPDWAMLLCIMTFIDRALMAYKWNLLLRAQGAVISFWQALRLYFVGNLIGGFTPGGLGGDVYRVAALSALRMNDIVAATVLLERMIGFSIICAFALGTLPFSIIYLGLNSNSVVWAVVLLTILVVGTLVLALRSDIIYSIAPRLSYLSRFTLVKKFNVFFHTIAQFRHGKRSLILFMFLTVLELLTRITMSFLAVKSLGIDISILYIFCVVPLLYISIRLPISFQGVGIQEGLYVYFLMAAGFSAAAGLSVSLLMRFAVVILVYLPASIMLLLTPARLPKPDEAVQQACVTATR
jgi:uncharacterized protein (TIRG00374 family)